MIYHSSCARRGGLDEEEGSRKLWARQRRRTNQSVQKIEFPKNPHGRVSARAELTENSHRRVEITHDRVKPRFSDIHKSSRYTRDRDPHGRVEIPLGRVDARFLGYLRPISDFIWGLFGRLLARLLERLLEGCG